MAIGSSSVCLILAQMEARDDSIKMFILFCAWLWNHLTVETSQVYLDFELLHIYSWWPVSQTLNASLLITLRWLALLFFLLGLAQSVLEIHRGVLHHGWSLDLLWRYALSVLLKMSDIDVSSLFTNDFLLLLFLNRLETHYVEVSSLPLDWYSSIWNTLATEVVWIFNLFLLLQEQAWIFDLRLAWLEALLKGVIWWVHCLKLNIVVVCAHWPCLSFTAACIHHSLEGLCCLAHINRPVGWVLCSHHQQCLVSTNVAILHVSPLSLLQDWCPPIIIKI